MVVYDELDHDPADGDLFVLEFQQPVGGASWETAHRIGIERVKVSRSLCRLSWTKPGWFIHPLNSRTHERFGVQVVMMSDGPYDDCIIGDRIIGRVVGVYAGTAGAA